jgi:hypothetical protein
MICVGRDTGLAYQDWDEFVPDHHTLVLALLRHSVIVRTALPSERVYGVLSRRYASIVKYLSTYAHVMDEFVNNSDRVSANDRQNCQTRFAKAPYPCREAFVVFSLLARSLPPRASMLPEINVNL